MDLEVVKKIAEDLLRDLGFSPGVAVLEKEGTLNITLEVGEENAMLIGFHGETLNSLQSVLSLLLFKKLGAYTPLSLDVGGYRQEREEKIRQLAVNAADRSRFLAKPVELPPMPAIERRLVHVFVLDLPGVKSESIGEGRDRRVVVSPAEGKA